MPNLRTHYDNLQVTRTASDAVIRASYRALIQRYHPDRFEPRSEAERITKVLNEAYAVLGNPQSRRQYDEYLRLRDLHSSSNEQSSSPGQPEPKASSPAQPQPPASKRKLGNLVSVALLIGVLIVIWAIDNTSETATPAMPTSAVQPPGTSETESAASRQNQNTALVSTSPKTISNDTADLFDDAQTSRSADDRNSANNWDYVYRCQNTSGQIVYGNSSNLHGAAGCRKVFGYKLEKGSVLLPIALPLTGIVARDRKKLKAPLDIVAEPGANYFVKLVSPGSRTPVLTAFIRDGQKLSIKAPLGTYNLHIASGKYWYGPKYLFGPETLLSAAEQNFSFEETSAGYEGYTLELTPQINGNLHVRDVDASQW